MATITFTSRNDGEFDGKIFHKMIGKTVTRIDGGSQYSDKMHFYFDDGSSARFFHDRECCEIVEIEDICGDLDDLIGQQLLQSEEVTNQNKEGDDDDGTWTFYKFATIKGSVTVRWFSSTNYYSEDVSFKFFEKE